MHSFIQMVDFKLRGVLSDPTAPERVERMRIKRHRQPCLRSRRANDSVACIDLNPLRAGLVERPEEYRWNSIGYHVQTNNRDNFLSTDFGLKEFNVKSKKKTDQKVSQICL